MTNVPFRRSEACLICGGKDLTQYLDLGTQALANAYLTKERLTEPELKVPLSVFYCGTCHCSQLLDVVDREVLFREYAYSSSTSPQLLGHFSSYADDVMRRFPEQCASSVLEIASNDGILLKCFQKRGTRVLGVDPAANIAEAAVKEGVPTIADFFDHALVPRIVETNGQPGVICANNVLAHTDMPHEMVEGVRQLLLPDGVFVFEVQYFGDFFLNNEFDNVYHEHIAYFSFHPLVVLLEQHGLQPFLVEHVDTQGGSLRIFAGKTPLQFPVDPSVAVYLKRERDSGFDRQETYQQFAERPRAVRASLCAMLSQLKAQGKHIVGYGAAAKGNTLLQYCGIGTDYLDYIVDRAPAKQFQFTPGTHIPIFPPEKLQEDTPDYVLILAWNYAASIQERERWILERGSFFIVPIPEPVIISREVE